MKQNEIKVGDKVTALFFPMNDYATGIVIECEGKLAIDLPHSIGFLEDATEVQKVTQ